VPPRDWQLRVRDILDAIAAIQAHVRGMDWETFRGDQKTIDAVDYRLAVIGEAAAGVPPEIVQAHPEIPWRQMRDTRNVIIHAYFGVRTDVLWGTIHNDLLPLVPLLKRLLEAKA
jgi:uncharacterized protein with HEPN domain